VKNDEHLPPSQLDEIGVIDSGGVDEISVIPWGTLLKRRVASRVTMTQRKATLGVLLANVFTVSFTITLLVVSLKTVADDLGSTVSLMSWTITAPLLAFGVVGPAFGKAGDLWGQKRMFTYGLFFAGVFALLSAFAWNAPSLIVPCVTLTSLPSSGRSTSKSSLKRHSAHNQRQMPSIILLESGSLSLQR